MRTIEINYSDRLKKLPPYLFVDIDRAKRKAVAEGKDVINLGIGDPDQATPKPIIDTLEDAARDPQNHCYALDAGLGEFRTAIAGWYKRRFHVDLDPDTEILPLIGSKEGIGHFPLAFVNPGDRVLVPEPGYPVYQAATWFAGGEPVYMSLREENNFLPDLDALEKMNLERVRMMYINYPNNPTGATAQPEFFRNVVGFASRRGIIVCHDAAYTEVYYDRRPHSFLESEGAKEVGVEFHSLSKTYNMTGWRIGFVAGSEYLVRGLAKVKSNLDSGIFQAIQWAGTRALSLPEDDRERLLGMYRQRRDELVSGLQNAGWNVKSPGASFYVWSRIPHGNDSRSFALKLLERAAIVATPGVGFGPSGEGYIRFSLTAGLDRIREAVRRIAATSAWD